MKDTPDIELALEIVRDLYTAIEDAHQCLVDGLPDHAKSILGLYIDNEDYKPEWNTN